MMHKCLLAGLALLLLIQPPRPNPRVRIVAATADEITLAATASEGCLYSVEVNHAPWECYNQYTPVLTDTAFTAATFRWEKVGLERPTPGDMACIFWQCQPTPHTLMYGVDRKMVRAAAVYLPIVQGGEREK